MKKLNFLQHSQQQEIMKQEKNHTPYIDYETLSIQNENETVFWYTESRFVLPLKVIIW